MTLPELGRGQFVPGHGGKGTGRIFFDEFQIPRFGSRELPAPTLRFPQPEDDFVRSFIRPFRKRRLESP